MRPSRRDRMLAEGITHVGGVVWSDAPVPKRWHFCRPQSYGWVGTYYYERCACGAARIGRYWLERNSRKQPR